MTPDELTKPTVPIAYVLLTLQLAAERGVDRGAMLKGVQWPTALLEQADARIGLLHYGQLCLRAMHLTGEAAMGYEFGLRNNLTTHGFYGFGLMSQPTLRDAVEFGMRFAPLRLPGWSCRYYVDGNQAVFEAHETVPYGMLRQYAADMLMVSMGNSFQQLLTLGQPVAMELWFDCPEPEYYARYRERLPPARFSKGANQIRFPLEDVVRPLATANAVTARLVARECERELALLGYTENFLERVRAVLLNEQGQYPALDTVATRLSMSTRTLKRRLQQHGLSYQHLLDEARKRDCMRLLEDRSLTLEQIAERLGYSEATSFSRAFGKWTGKTPSAFRAGQALRRKV
jgi:AraC-like DNA-binding protein